MAVFSLFFCVSVGFIRTSWHAPFWFSFSESIHFVQSLVLKSTIFYFSCGIEEAPDVHVCLCVHIRGDIIWLKNSTVVYTCEEFFTELTLSFDSVLLTFRSARVTEEMWSLTWHHSMAGGMERNCWDTSCHKIRPRTFLALNFPEDSVPLTMIVIYVYIFAESIILMEINPRCQTASGSTSWVQLLYKMDRGINKHGVYLKKQQHIYLQASRVQKAPMIVKDMGQQHGLWEWKWSIFKRRWKQCSHQTIKIRHSAFIMWQSLMVLHYRLPVERALLNEWLHFSLLSIQTESFGRAVASQQT